MAEAAKAKGKKFVKKTKQPVRLYAKGLILGYKAQQVQLLRQLHAAED